MKFLDANSNIFFNLSGSIGDYAKDIEDTLDKEYTIAVLGNDLEDIDKNLVNEVPMVIAHKCNGQEIIEFCNNKVKISINFDEKLENNINGALKYVRYTINSVLEFLQKIDGIEFRFSGVYCTIIVEEMRRPVELLKGKLAEKVSNVMESKEVYDISSKLTFVEEESHFINIKLSNIRGNMQLDNQQGLTQKINCLSVELDINDRYGFNEYDNYKSSPSSMEKNLEILDKIVFYKINDIIAL